MVKLLVISDSHGNTTLAEKVINKHRDVDMVIHLGDYFRDANRLEDLFPKLHFEYVYGNSDFMIGDVPIEKILEIEGQRVLLTHGHRYSVKWGTDRLQNTHIPQVEHLPACIILNPGSISDPRGEDDESYAIVTIDSFKIDVELMNAV